MGFKQTDPWYSTIKYLLSCSELVNMSYINKSFGRKVIESTIKKLLDYDSVNFANMFSDNSKPQHAKFDIVLFILRYSTTLITVVYILGLIHGAMMYTVSY